MFLLHFFTLTHLFQSISLIYCNSDGFCQPYEIIAWKKSLDSMNDWHCMTKNEVVEKSSTYTVCQKNVKRMWTFESMKQMSKEKLVYSNNIPFRMVVPSSLFSYRFHSDCYAKDRIRFIQNVFIVFPKTTDKWYCSAMTQFASFFCLFVWNLSKPFIWNVPKSHGVNFTHAKKKSFTIQCISTKNSARRIRMEFIEAWNAYPDSTKPIVVVPMTDFMSTAQIVFPVWRKRARLNFGKKL